MNSFSSELGIPFGTLLEAPHVIDVESQVWASVISTGPNNYPLNASFKTADAYAFQDAVGQSLEELFKVVPGGALVFFPSYKLMEKLCKRWSETGQWYRLNANKLVFVEPRGGSQDDFDTTLKGYYSALRPGIKPTLGKRRKSKKVNSNGCSEANSVVDSKNGAAFLAVCRGKVSEGIDFSDENARLVIIVGIPFPNIYDVQVAEKKKYNDTYKCSKNLLSGSDWYCNQAFRALNQAAGRCIRHKDDYGAIIFLDERFREERNTIYISKWLRKSLRTYDNFEASVDGLKSFFANIKDRVGNASTLENPVNDLENIHPDNSLEISMKQSSLVSHKSEAGKKSIVSCITRMPSTELSHCFSRSQRNEGIQHSCPVLEENVDTQKDIFVSCHSGDNLRYRGTTCSVSNEEWLELSVVKETPMVGNYTLASPEPSIDGDFCRSSIIPTSTDRDQAHHVSLTDSTQSPSNMTCALVTPERRGIENIKRSTQEVESSANLSVNSHAHKKRMLNPSQRLNLIQNMKFQAVIGENGHDISTMNCSALNDISNHQRIKFESELKFSESELMPVVQPLVNIEGNIPSKFGGASLDHRLQIFCSICKTPLGLPEKNSYVACLLTSLSKMVLRSLCKGNGEKSQQTSHLVQVLIVDDSSIDQRLYNRNGKDIQGQGIWCQEDGCVYNSIFCPFCVSSSHCLGVQIMAADKANVQLIGKILFFCDRLEVKASSTQQSKALLINNGSSACEVVADTNAITKYAYRSPQQSPGGWRTTKSKSKLLKRSPMSKF